MPLQIDVADGTGRRGCRPLRYAEWDVEDVVPYNVLLREAKRLPLQMWDIIYRRGGVSLPFSRNVVPYGDNKIF